MLLDTTITKANGENDDRYDMEKAATNRLTSLIAKVNRAKPDPEALAELRSLLNEHPVVADIFGDVSRYARDEVIRPIAGDQQGVKLGIERKMRNLAVELGYEDTPALEKLFIENVALCWARYHDLLRRYMIVNSESIPLAKAEYWERRLDRAHVQYLRACTDLAKVRKMLRPMQVNIGMNQINVAK